MDELKKIIELAARAPSGENAQPWQFKIADNKIYQYLVPERDQSVYNVNQYASYVANGAALENIEIASRALGFLPKTQILPDPKDPNLVAVITLEKSQPQDEPLYEYIEKRVTNRKPYKKEPLTTEQKQALLSQKVEGAEFLLTDDPKHIEALAEVGATNEYIMLQNKAIHNFFFSHLNWTEAEEQEKRYGFYIKTLELPPPARAMFKLFKHWPVMRVFNALGFPKLVLKQNTQVYAAAGAMAAIIISSATPQDFINAGRLTERVWLEATKVGLSMQPLTGVLFFMLRVQFGDRGAFIPIEIQLIKEKYSLVKQLFNIPQQKTIAMMFRVGVGGNPTTQSARYKLDNIMRP